jgi:hypothetical protein
MKLAIVGSRSFKDYDKFKSEIKSFISRRSSNDITTIISGGAYGADSLAKRYAKENKIDYVEFPALWDKFGKRAGYLRNIDIIKNCDWCIAFWDGKSPGTQHSINLCNDYNKPLDIIYI